MIKPTVGRVVWYYPDGSNANTPPLAAIIATVWSDRCVNLMVIEQNGVPMSHPPTSVTLVQDGELIPKRTDGTFSRYCCWMPYQVGQAAKAEALQQQLESTRQP